jgi:hypothetical protein
MKKLFIPLVSSVLMFFILACGLGSVVQQLTGIKSIANATLPHKKFDGQLNIVDQWYMAAADGTINYGLIIENTSQTLTVTQFDQSGSISDSSGSPVAILNLGNDAGLFNIQRTIYPGSKGIVCMNYQVEKGTDVAAVDFTLGSNIQAVDLSGAPNPISIETAEYSTATKYSNANAVGSVVGRISNQTDKDLLYPYFYAAGYDAAGKLNSCGSIDENYLFIPANASMPVRLSLFGSDKPASVELFPSQGYIDEDIQKYKQAEPIQVSEVKFAQFDDRVLPLFTLTNSADGMLIDALINAIVYGPDDEVLFTLSYRKDGIPAGMSTGPDQARVWTIPQGKTVSRVVIQVHTLDVRPEGKEITAESVTFAPATYNPDTHILATTIDNTTAKELSAGIAAVCYDDGGNVIGEGSDRVVLPPNAQTAVEVNESVLGKESACATASRIEFNFWSISGN